MTDDISYARVKFDAESARTYSQRKNGKHRQEMAMIEDAMRHVQGVTRMLDAPCGVGRAAIWLAQQGINVTGVDLGDAALHLAATLASEAGVQVAFERQDIFDLPYSDKSFDATLCFRLLHHFESPDLRSRLIDELCRVSRTSAALSDEWQSHQAIPGFSPGTARRTGSKRVRTGRADRPFCPVSLAATAGVQEEMRSVYSRFCKYVEILCYALLKKL